MKTRRASPAGLCGAPVPGFIPSPLPHAGLLYYSHDLSCKSSSSVLFVSFCFSLTFLRRNHFSNHAGHRAAIRGCRREPSDMSAVRGLTLQSAAVTRDVRRARWQAFLLHGPPGHRRRPPRFARHTSAAMPTLNLKTRELPPRSCPANSSSHGGCVWAPSFAKLSTRRFPVLS